MTSNSDFYGMFSFYKPANPSQKEWSWCGPYESRREALRMTKLVQKQWPRNFDDYLRGPVVVSDGLDNFLKKAASYGLTPIVECTDQQPEPDDLSGIEIDETEY